MVLVITAAWDNLAEKDRITMSTLRLSREALPVMTIHHLSSRTSHNGELLVVLLSSTCHHVGTSLEFDTSIRLTKYRLHQIGSSPRDS